MRKAIINATLAGLLLCGATVASAQTSQGRGFGTTLDVLGTNIITQGDTGTKNAPNPANTPNPNGFDGNAGPATLPAAPLANVVTGPSRTRGCAVPSACPELFATPGTDPLDPALSNETFAHSTGGDATVAVLPGAAPGGSDVLDAVSSGSSVTVRCNNDTLGTVIPQAVGTSHVDALVVAGNVVPVPGSSSPNTTILAPQLPLLVLNEQNCSLTTTSATCTVNALHAQLVTMSQVLDLKLSGSSGTITFNPEACTCNGPLLTNSRKRSQVQTPGGAPKNPPAAPNDRIRYTIDLFNTGCVTAQGVMVVDQIPLGTMFVPGSVTVGGTPMPNIMPGDCGGVTFPDCPPQTAPQCLTVTTAVPVDSVNPTQVAFTVTVNSGSTGGNNPGCDQNGMGPGICNDVRILVPGSDALSVERSNSIPCPNGTPTPSGTQTPGAGTPGAGTPGAGTPGAGTPGAGTPKPPETDRLVTTGGGGCSLGDGPNGFAAQMVPVLGVGLLLGIRQWRRRASRAK